MVEGFYNHNLKVDWLVTAYSGIVIVSILLSLHSLPYSGLSERNDLGSKSQTCFNFPCILNAVYPDMGKLAWPEMQVAREK